MAALLFYLKPGEEVIMPSYTFVSTANAFVLRGAVPVFIDIRPDTLNMDETLIEEVSNTNTLGNIFTTGGNIGIETTAPTQALSVNGGAAPIKFLAQATKRMRITSSGNVGIGTTAPTYSLQILQDNTGAYPGDNTTGQLVISGIGTSSPCYTLDVSGAGRFTGGLTIATGGNVSIGTSSPCYTLDVSGAGRFTGGLTIATSTPGAWASNN
ncbi:hypothetical protein DAPPUDRAFT_120485 [Daphnia pulex]|uniref:Uncharacterized protein n=1 Tax=Daphnia pulex TaxID=6669 RepID=E9I1J5_DAPPU|nr:hypothetical protein DAPPUDRAFT_120485 [Daphnia pulex]|eukprot:EFX62135.1 hypothetical protein DAPPUDRAFT_120485 [Daphnia pulex]